MENPYQVVKNLDINQVQDLLNQKWNEGYKAFEIMHTGGANIAVIFVMKNTDRSTPVAGAYSSGN
jgi:hypothetical protein